MTAAERARHNLSAAVEARRVVARTRAFIRSLDMSAARRELAALLRDPPTGVGGVRIAYTSSALLRWPCGWGADTERRLLKHAGLVMRTADRRLRDLTEREREALAVTIERHGQ
jgi:hypothetical protein